jgi:ribonuclease G
MSKELIISANVHEKKVAIVEDGVVTEFYVERRDENQGVVGNLYKGRVMKVLPGMQSAFVDIGLERDAFLYVSDFTEFMEEEEGIDFREAEEGRAAARPEDRARRGERPRPELVAAPETARPPAAEAEPAAERPVRIEDAVEQLAEIAVERVIPPPPPEEELGEETPALERAEVAPVERMTDEETAAGAAFEEATAADIEAKPRRGRGRKTADADLSKAKRRTVKAEEKPARAPKGKPAPKAGSKRTRQRGEPEEELTPEPADMIEQLPDYQFERVTDEDLVQEAGELLKDAIVQEKIFEQVHTAEYQTEAPLAEPVAGPPEPEWRVGSLRSMTEAGASFQRVVDENADYAARRDLESETVEDPSPQEPDQAKTSPFRHISGVVRGLYGRIQSGTPGEKGETDESDVRIDLREAEWETRPEDAGELEHQTREGVDEDREAEIRDRGTRAEFAVRRGGRGRRGRGRRDTQTGTQPAAVADEEAASAPPAPEEVAEKAEVAQPAGEEAAEAGARPAATQGESRAQATRTHPRRDRRPEGRRGEGRRPEQGFGRRPERGGPATISELLHEGQEILVQIAKEPIAKKGARITSHIALPGRLIVYMPTVNHIGVSRKIPNEVERVRLKRIVTALRDREGAVGGFIARTACAGHSEQELADDMRYLLRTWADVRKKAERVRAPSLVHRDLDLVQRILRDQLSEEFSAIRIDNEVEYARIVEFVNRVQPRLVKRVKLYIGKQPILEKYGVQAEIDKAVRPRVWLKSGGYIVINQTEALVAIDVNTGKFVGKSDKLEDTITRTNLEAAKEIVRQVRLRDLGGIIVIDFIDMEERKNRQKVMMALQHELSHDRAPSKVLSVNDFGLVAITRKRVKQSLERTLCTPCPYCQGAGMVKSAQTMCFEILEQAKAIAAQAAGSSDVMLRVSPHVAEAFRTSEREVLEEIEAHFATPVTLEPDPNLHQEQFDFAIV